MYLLDVEGWAEDGGREKDEEGSRYGQVSNWTDLERLNLCRLLFLVRNSDNTCRLLVGCLSESAHPLRVSFFGVGDK